MGALKAQAGHYAEALAYFRPAYARDPKFTDLARNYALALTYEGTEQKKAGRRLEAMALYQEALAVSPGDVEARRQLDALTAEATGTTAPARLVDAHGRIAIMAPLANPPYPFGGGHRMRNFRIRHVLSALAVPVLFVGVMLRLLIP